MPKAHPALSDLFLGTADYYPGFGYDATGVSLAVLAADADVAVYVPMVCSLSYVHFLSLTVDDQELRLTAPLMGRLFIFYFLP
jgi:hypothetical protein